MDHPARKIRFVAICFLLGGFFLSSAAQLCAQAGRAELTGQIKDQSGALVAHVRVTITELATLQAVSSLSSDSGDYTVTNLKPGIYSVEVEADGFKHFTREGVQLATGERVRLDISLEPGAV